MNGYVILNSNQVKTEAFYQTALPYGQHAAQALVDYHVAHGGISRYQKLAYFLDHIIPADQTGPELATLLDRFAQHVQQGLLTCSIAHGLPQLREQTAQARWLIVSGGDQAELREVFAQGGLAPLFDGGIFGSPDTKEAILSRELANGNIQPPALFLGDSRYDYQAATQAGLEFVFISKWSEVKDWQGWCAQEAISTVPQLADFACAEDGIDPRKPLSGE